MAHDRPVRLTTHDDAHAGLFCIQDVTVLSFFDCISLKKAKSFTITKYAAAMLKGRPENEKSLFAESAKFELIFAIENRLWYFKLSVLTLIRAAIGLSKSGIE